MLNASLVSIHPFRPCQGCRWLLQQNNAIQKLAMPLSHKHSVHWNHRPLSDVSLADLNFRITWSASSVQTSNERPPREGHEAKGEEGGERSFNCLHGFPALPPLLFFHMIAFHWHQLHYTLKNSLLTPLGCRFTCKHPDRQNAILSPSSSPWYTKITEGLHPTALLFQNMKNVQYLFYSLEMGNLPITCIEWYNLKLIIVLH